MTKKMTYNATALVTGGAKRIGKELALALSSLGYCVALHYHSSASDAKKTAKLIDQNGGRCELFKADLNNERDQKTLIKTVSARFPNLSILINNASVFKQTNLRKLNIKQLNQDLNVHLKAPYILIGEFARICKKGQVINIIDANVAKNNTPHFSYSLTKKALLHLTEMAASDLAPHIRVNGIAPGLIYPPERKSMSYLNRRAKDIPLKRKGEISNITSSLEFLINNDYLTGQLIYVDGGEHLI